MDPFRSLRLPALAVDPDPEFARALKQRLTDGTDEGAPVITQALTPYLAVRDARSALRFYAEAFGATEVMEPIVMPDGRIGHAEILIAGAKVMLADEFPDIGHTAPTVGQGSPVTLHLELRDVDGTYRRAVNAGATGHGDPQDGDHGRTATVTDPFGHRWMLHGQPTGVIYESTTHGIRHGDIGYLSILVPDVAQAEKFFHHVLAWEIAHQQVVGQTIAMGFAQPTNATEHQGALFVIGVRDVDAACAAVVAQGGTADTVDDETFGRIADCVDSQGMAFSLYTPTGGVSAGAGLPVNGELHGDISYLTILTPDSAALRALLTAVGGWEFTGGRINDGWEARTAVPMTGLAGGQDAALVKAMFRVDDIDAAVIRVREAGGTATDVVQAPYGRTSECTDDQGTEFWLAQH